MLSEQLVINCEPNLFLHDKCSFLKCLSYLKGRRLRTMDCVVSICNAIHGLVGPKSEVQFLLLFNSLSCLPVAIKGGLEKGRMAIAEDHAAWKKQFQEVGTLNIMSRFSAARKNSLATDASSYLLHELS